MSSRIIPCPVCKEKDFHFLLEVKGNRGVDFIDSSHRVVLCKNCGLCLLNPQHSEFDYENYYKKYDRPKGTGMLYNPKVDRSKYDALRVSFLNKNIPSKDSKILDIGSGYGAIMRHLKKLGYSDVTGIEPSEEAAKISREELNLNVHTGVVADKILPVNYYDVAILVAVAEHFTDPVGSLKEIKSLLKDGGLLYVNTLNLRELILLQGINKYFKFVHTFYYTEKSLRNILRMAGFEIVKSETTPAVRKYFYNFLPVSNKYEYSELNIIARKVSESTPVTIEKEDWREIEKIIRKRWRSDRFYYYLLRLFSKLNKIIKR